MTVSYTADVANASSFGCFTKILLRWKGSVYKLIYKELAAYLCIYFLLNTVYRSVLCTPGHEWGRHFFESLKAYCSIQMSSIPMTFGLGFYVSLIVKRWWDQYSLLPWPDSLAVFIVGLLRSRSDNQQEKEEARTMRRNIMRCILLAYIITLRRVSLRVRKRFPTHQHVVDAGLMRADELKQMESLNDKCTVSKWWMPLVWATSIVAQARSDGKINNDPGVQTILNEVSAIRKGLTGVQHYDTISVPLVYTQVVTLAVYTYFGAALMGAQWVAPVGPEEYKSLYKLPAFLIPNNGTDTNDGNTLTYQPLDLYIPVFLSLQFIFYVGWLKVAETLINPFGEDDDDFELNYLIDRHVQVSYMIVDDMQETVTKEQHLTKDMHYDQFPFKLPYTNETEHLRKAEPKGSAELIEEADNISSTYYKFIPFGATNKPRPAQGPIASATFATASAAVAIIKPTVDGVLGEDIILPGDPSSEYESIDPTFFNWWRKGKLTKSQRGDAAVYQGQRRKVSQDQKSTKSFKSQRSIYAKLSSRINKSVRRRREQGGGGKQLLATEAAAVNVVEIESDVELGNNKVEEQPENNRFDVNPVEEPEELDTKQEVDQEEEIVLSHLQTITEQNTPYSTQPTSIRRNSKGSSYPTAEAVFASKSPLIAKVLKSKLNTLEQQMTESESHAYYPLGSEASSMNDPGGSARLFTEEIPNYEPIQFQEKEKKSEPGSPALPKRQPVMSLVPIAGEEEEKETPEEEKSSRSNEDNANSAFNNATFYV